MPVLFVAFIIQRLATHTTMFQSTKVNDKDPSIKRLVMKHCCQVPPEQKGDYAEFLMYIKMSQSGFSIWPVGLISMGELATAICKLVSFTGLIYSCLVTYLHLEDK